MEYIYIRFYHAMNDYEWYEKSVVVSLATDIKKMEKKNSIVIIFNSFSRTCFKILDLSLKIQAVFLNPSYAVGIWSCRRVLSSDDPVSTGFLDPLKFATVVNWALVVRLISMRHLCHLNVTFKEGHLITRSTLLVWTEMSYHFLSSV